MSAPSPPNLLDPRSTYPVVVVCPGGAEVAMEVQGRTTVDRFRRDLASRAPAVPEGFTLHASADGAEQLSVEWRRLSYADDAITKTLAAGLVPRIYLRAPAQRSTSPQRAAAARHSRQHSASARPTTVQPCSGPLVPPQAAQAQQQPQQQQRPSSWRPSSSGGHLRRPLASPPPPPSLPAPPLPAEAAAEAREAPQGRTTPEIDVELLMTASSPVIELALLMRRLDAGASPAAGAAREGGGPASPGASDAHGAGELGKQLSPLACVLPTPSEPLPIQQPQQQPQQQQQQQHAAWTRSPGSFVTASPRAYGAAAASPRSNGGGCAEERAPQGRAERTYGVGDLPPPHDTPSADLLVESADNRQALLAAISVIERVPLTRHSNGYLQCAAEAGFTPWDMRMADLAIDQEEAREQWYAAHFEGREHWNYVADAKGSPVVVSVLPMAEATKTWRVIYRTPEGDFKRFATAKASSKGLPPIKDIVAAVAPKGAKLPSKFKLVDGPRVVSELASFELDTTRRTFKFGIVYGKQSDMNEQDYLSNVGGSNDWREFLMLMGDYVKLKDWPMYSAGLDTKKNLTGEVSLYTQWKNYEVMFHVSTLMPFSQTDRKQCERKRFLANNIGMIVFKEGGQPYAGDTILSEKTHIIAVVQKFGPLYRAEFITKEGVPPFGPRIPVPCVFSNPLLFREFLLTKLVNGETAVLSRSTALKQKLQRARCGQLEQLIRTLDPPDDS
eukprot:m51a1_g5920 hypothetical protein (728) ;mRNA; f:56884-59330